MIGRCSFFTYRIIRILVISSFSFICSLYFIASFASMGITKAEKSGRFSFTHLVYRFSAFFVPSKTCAPVLYTYAHYVLYLLRHRALACLTFSSKNIIINASKGIEKSTHFLPYEIVEAIVGKKIDYYSLIGPSLAKEVREKMPTIVNIGYIKESTNNELVKKLFQTKFFRVKLAKGVEALELSAGFKNIYAISCGIAEGLGYGMNTKSELLTLAITEINTLYKNLNLRFDPNITFGTTGDLVLSCMGSGSRNFTFGKLLVKYSVEESLNRINSTVEGFYSLLSVAHFERKTKSKLPLASFIADVVLLNNPKQLKKHFEDFIVYKW